MKKQVSEIDVLAFELFQTFARVEYSLKASGFHNGDGKAEASWDKFANSIDGKLEADPKSRDAVAYMQASPPKKQMIVSGLLEWQPVSPNPNLTKELLLCVRRVRNNLFHGGKFNGHWFAPDRSEELLKHSLSILESCLRASTDLNDAYNN